MSEYTFRWQVKPGIYISLHKSVWAKSFVMWTVAKLGLFICVCASVPAVAVLVIVIRIYTSASSSDVREK
jgi:hypothetical protein